MRHSLSAAILGTFLVSGSMPLFAADAAPAAAATALRPGLAYRLDATIPADGNAHQLEFVLYDAHRGVVARETFTVKLALRYGPVASPIFTIFHSAQAAAEARRRADALVVEMDGARVEEIPYSELLSRASELTLIDSSRIAFGGEFARTAGDRVGVPKAPQALHDAAAPKLRLQTETESWQGCADDEYCYAQWNYCNENCAPWDPYLPCQACNSNLTECTGGTMTNSWSTNDLVSQTHNRNVCDAFDPGTFEEWTSEIRHREYQTWRCTEEDGDHYTTINTVDSTHYETCYTQAINNSCPGLAVVNASCRF
jgi:hypothetical protein